VNPKHGNPTFLVERVLSNFSSVFHSVHNAAQILLAVLGFVGTGMFLLSHLFAARGCCIIQPRFAQAALLLGLTAWLAMTLLRHDVVAATGLLITMALLWRFFQAGS